MWEIKKRVYRRMKEMFEKYISIKESNIVAKQTSGGVWYCSELPARTTIELDGLIGEVNKILNKYNNNIVKKAKETKEDPKVKGLV